MYISFLTVLILCSGISLGQLPPDVSLPRLDAAIGIWPLTGYYGLRDISGKGLDGTAIVYSSTGVVQGKVDSSAGPFGDPRTSYTSSPDGYHYGIFYRSSNPSKGDYLWLNSSFTISFFVKVPSTKYLSYTSYDLLHFLYDKDKYSTKPFGITYEIGSDNMGSLQRFAFDAKLSKINIDPSIWNFHAITFNASTCMLTTYNRFGRYQSPQYESSICKSFPYNNNGFRLGRRESGSVGYFHYQMSVSCLSMFSDILSDDQVMQIFDACRAILQAQPCGTPRLPGLPNPPTLPPVAPRRGQFPALAAFSLRGVYKCSAVIINEFWLLTSASCLKSGVISSQDSVISIGVNDISTATLNHAVRTFYVHESYSIVSGKSVNDIALIELMSPIDFGSPYVSDMCLPWSWYSGQFSTSNNSLYFAGWGRNGGSSLVSDTSLRYSAGTKLPPSNCSTIWGSVAYRPDSMQCWLSDFDQSVPCTGDEGGPLTVLSDNKVYRKLIVTGLYSYRDSNCSQAEKAPIFTSVEAYLPWIYARIGCAIPGRVYPSSCPL